MRLIDADKLVKTFCSHCVDHDECKSECMDLKIIKSMKTVDAQPIRHGHWDSRQLVYECSECGNMGYSDMNYCPNCGAKMDEIKE